MKTLMIGAGAIGGYFGGQLLATGRSVTLLVRPRRAAQLAETGLVIKSSSGNLNIRNSPTIQASALHQHMDAGGRIIHLGDTHTLTFGERDGVRTEQARAIEAEFSGAKFNARLSDDILQEM